MRWTLRATAGGGFLFLSFGITLIEAKETYCRGKSDLSFGITLTVLAKSQRLIQTGQVAWRGTWLYSTFGHQGCQLLRTMADLIVPVQFTTV